MCLQMVGDILYHQVLRRKQHFHNLCRCMSNLLCPFKLNRNILSFLIIGQGTMFGLSCKWFYFGMIVCFFTVNLFLFLIIISSLFFISSCMGERNLNYKQKRISPSNSMVFFWFNLELLNFLVPPIILKTLTKYLLNWLNDDQVL